MVKCFYDRFYRPYSEVMVKDLMNLNQHVDELVANFLENFKMLRSQCNLQFLELEYANIAIGNINPRLKENLIA